MVTHCIYCIYNDPSWVAQGLLSHEVESQMEAMMGNLVQLPLRKPEATSKPQASKIVTHGDSWVSREQKMLDRVEFLEAMILVLDDVRLQNIRSRDYAMMEIVSEEIPLYELRLEQVKQELLALRQEYCASKKSIAT